MLSSSGRHRAPKTRRSTRLLATAGLAGAGLALPLLNATSAHAAPATSAPAAQPTTPHSAAAHTYTVVAGDRLSTIAGKEHVSGGWQRLYELNRSKLAQGPNLIFPGQRLVLDGNTAPALAAASIREAAPAAARAVAWAVVPRSARAAAPAAARAVAWAVVPRSARAAAPAAARATGHANNLDGWIRQAQDILRAHGDHVPSYQAMHATAMAESGGNPNAVNGWDSNAKAGHPSIGLAQMIQATFNAFALPGHTDIRNPVDNLIAASRYTDKVYGGMDAMAAARCYGNCWRGY